MDTFDAEGLRILTDAECLRMMGSVPVGRVVFHEGGLPAVRVVNFAVDGRSVVFRSAPGGKTRAAERGDVVAFEVDRYDADRHLGWTVTVIGHASLVTDPGEVDEVMRLPIARWAPGPHSVIVRIGIESVAGRSVVPWAQRPRDQGTKALPRVGARAQA
jgi:nitroimidazol reductase NimA-like FMN-containing flavoprotein (pyridoxamine 5'-phosphate oxidase superfamily)